MLKTGVIFNFYVKTMIHVCRILKGTAFIKDTNLLQQSDHNKSACQDKTRLGDQQTSLCWFKSPLPHFY